MKAIKKKQKVVIIGGGLAGGCCARVLLDKGFKVTVIEKQKLGGLLNSIFLGPFRCDIGPHFVYHEPTNRRIFDFVNKYTETYRTRAKCKTFPTGLLLEPHDYPVSLRNIEMWNDKDDIHHEIEACDSQKECSNLAVYIKNMVGERLYERYFKHYSEKFWGIDPEQIGTEWAPHRLRFSKKQERFFKGKSEFYPIGGYSKFISALFKGADVIYGEAAELSAEDSKITAVRTSNGKEIPGDYLISTIDPSIYMSDSDLKLRYRSLVVVAAVGILQERKYFFRKGVNWGYFPNTYKFTRVTDYTSFDILQMARREAVLTFEYPSFVGDEIWNSDIRYFLGQINQFMRENGLSFDPIRTSLLRIEKAYPLPTKSEQEKYNEIEKRLDEYDNLYITGRFGHYKFTWMKNIMEDAFRIGECINRRRL